jgi:hypothetical protein
MTIIIPKCERGNEYTKVKGFYERQSSEGDEASQNVFNMKLFCSVKHDAIIVTTYDNTSFKWKTTLFNIVTGCGGCIYSNKENKQASHTSD